MITTATKPLTIDEYMSLEQCDGIVELSRGEIVQVSQTQALHGRITGNLANVFAAHIYNQGLPYVAEAQLFGVPIPRAVKDTSRTPDVCIVTPAQYEELELKKALLNIDEPPLLVVEVVSPSTYKTDHVDKVEDYALAKVPEYYAVDYVDPSNRLVTLYQDGKMQRQYEPDEWIDLKLFPNLKLKLSQVLKKLNYVDLAQF